MAAALDRTQLPIAVFDSGVGGLTVLHECLVSLPEEDFVYLGDDARFPYGARSQEVLRSQACCHPQGVQQKYPDDRWLTEMGIEGYVGIPLIDASGRVLGLVSALSRSPLRRPESDQSS